MWSLQKQNSLKKIRVKESQESISLSIRSKMCSLYNICHIEMDYSMKYKFMCDHCKNKIPSKTRVKESQEKDIHHQFGAQKWSLYNIYHIEMDYNMNYKFMCNCCEIKSAHKHKLKDHKEKDHLITV